MILGAVMDLLSVVLWLANPAGVERRLAVVASIAPAEHRRQVAIAAVTSVTALALAVGLLTLRNWARWSILIVVGASTLWWLGGTVLKGRMALLDTTVSLGFAGFIFWYFLRPSIRHSFDQVRNIKA